MTSEASSVEQSNVDMLPHCNFSTCAAGGISYQGRRNENEDRMSYTHALLYCSSGIWRVASRPLDGLAAESAGGGGGVPAMSRSIRNVAGRASMTDVDSYHLFAVYDGHGGEEVADYVKVNMVQCLAQALRESVVDAQSLPDRRSEDFWVDRGRLRAARMHSGTVSSVRSKSPTAPDGVTPSAHAAADDALASGAVDAIADACGNEDLYKKGLRRYHSMVLQGVKFKSPFAAGVQLVRAGEDTRLTRQQTISSAVADALHRAILLLDGKLAEQVASAKTQGTTALLAMVGSKKIVFGNVGDSRAVICRAGQSLQISADQTPARADEHQRVVNLGGYVVKNAGDRVMGVLSMTRALGDLNLRPFVIPDPETYVHQRTKDDELVILATDGLWDIVSNDTACRLCRRAFFRSQSKGHTPNKVACIAAQCLAMHAIRQGSQDNVTVVVLDLLRSAVNLPSASAHHAPAPTLSPAAVAVPSAQSENIHEPGRPESAAGAAPQASYERASALRASAEAPASTSADIAASPFAAAVDCAEDASVGIASIAPSSGRVLASWHFKTPADCPLTGSGGEQRAPTRSPFACMSQAEFPDHRPSEIKAAPQPPPAELRPSRQFPLLSRALTMVPEAPGNTSPFAALAQQSLAPEPREPLRQTRPTGSAPLESESASDEEPSLRRFQTATMARDDEWRSALASSLPVKSAFTTAQSLASPGWGLESPPRGSSHSRTSKHAVE